MLASSPGSCSLVATPLTFRPQATNPSRYSVRRGVRNSPVTPSREREDGYSVKEDRITDDDWDVVLQYLRLLVEFVDATKHLEGNREEKDYAGTQGALWEVFPWLSIMAKQIDTALLTMPDEEELEPSYFKESLILGKEKLDLYWAMMTDDTPYYYAAVVLHPNLQLAWFREHWKKWPTWISDVEVGMVKFYKQFMEDLERGQEDVEEVEIPLMQRRKVPEAVRLRREKDKALGIITGDSDDAFTQSLRVDPVYFNRSARKRARVESELDIYYRYRPGREVSDPLAFWLVMAKDSKCGFPTVAKLAINVFSILAMSAECERVFSQTKRLITDDRNSLGDLSIEAVQCQKNWLNNRVVRSSLYQFH